MILVVDAHDDAREALCAMLRAEGYLVSMAASGAKALGLLGLFDSLGLILIDLSLPDMSGAEFLAELRGRPLVSLIPVVAMTTDHRVQPAGVQGWLRKPYSPEQVMEFVLRYCGTPNGWDGATGGAMA